MNFFTDPRCSCPSVEEHAVAGLHGVEVEPRCPVHQADAIETHKVERELETAREHFAEVRTIVDRLNTPPEHTPACSCDVAADLATAIAGGTIEPCEIHRPAVSPIGDNNAGLNSDPLYTTLCAKVGATPDDGPPAAA